MLKTKTLKLQIYHQKNTEMMKIKKRIILDQKDLDNIWKIGKNSCYCQKMNSKTSTVLIIMKSQAGHI